MANHRLQEISSCYGEGYKMTSAFEDYALRNKMDGIYAEGSAPRGADNVHSIRHTATDIAYDELLDKVTYRQGAIVSMISPSRSRLNSLMGQISTKENWHPAPIYLYFSEKPYNRDMEREATMPFSSYQMSSRKDFDEYVVHNGVRFLFHVCFTYDVARMLANEPNYLIAVDCNYYIPLTQLTATVSRLRSDTIVYCVYDAPSELVPSYILWKAGNHNDRYPFHNSNKSEGYHFRFESDGRVHYSPHDMGKEVNTPYVCEAENWFSYLAARHLNGCSVSTEVRYSTATTLITRARQPNYKKYRVMSGVIRLPVYENRHEPNLNACFIIPKDTADATLKATVRANGDMTINDANMVTQARVHIANFGSLNADMRIHLTPAVQLRLAATLKELQKPVKYEATPTAMSSLRYSFSMPLRRMYRAVGSKLFTGISYEKRIQKAQEVDSCDPRLDGYGPYEPYMTWYIPDEDEPKMNDVLVMDPDTRCAAAVCGLLGLPSTSASEDSCRLLTFLCGEDRATPNENYKGCGITLYAPGGCYHIGKRCAHRMEVIITCAEINRNNIMTGVHTERPHQYNHVKAVKRINFNRLACPAVGKEMDAIDEKCVKLRSTPTTISPMAFKINDGAIDNSLLEDFKKLPAAERSYCVLLGMVPEEYDLAEMGDSTTTLSDFMEAERKMRGLMEDKVVAITVKRMYACFKIRVDPHCVKEEVVDTWAGEFREECPHKPVGHMPYIRMRRYHWMLRIFKRNRLWRPDLGMSCAGVTDLLLKERVAFETFGLLPHVPISELSDDDDQAPTVSLIPRAPQDVTDYSDDDFGSTITGLSDDDSREIVEEKIKADDISKPLLTNEDEGFGEYLGETECDESLDRILEILAADDDVEDEHLARRLLDNETTSTDLSAERRDVPEEVNDPPDVSGAGRSREPGLTMEDFRRAMQIALEMSPEPDGPPPDHWLEMPQLMDDSDDEEPLIPDRGGVSRQASLVDEELASITEVQLDERLARKQPPFDVFTEDAMFMRLQRGEPILWHPAGAELSMRELGQRKICSICNDPTLRFAREKVCMACHHNNTAMRKKFNKIAQFSSTGMMEVNPDGTVVSTVEPYIIGSFNAGLLTYQKYGVVRNRNMEPMSVEEFMAIESDLRCLTPRTYREGQHRCECDRPAGPRGCTILCEQDFLKLGKNVISMTTESHTGMQTYCNSFAYLVRNDASTFAVGWDFGKAPSTRRVITKGAVNMVVNYAGTPLYQVQGGVDHPYLEMKEEYRSQNHESPNYTPKCGSIKNAEILTPMLPYCKRVVVFGSEPGLMLYQIAKRHPECQFFFYDIIDHRGPIPSNVTFGRKHVHHHDIQAIVESIGQVDLIYDDMYDLETDGPYENVTGNYRSDGHMIPMVKKTRLMGANCHHIRSGSANEAYKFLHFQVNHVELESEDKMLSSAITEMLLENETNNEHMMYTLGQRFLTQPGCTSKATDATLKFKDLQVVVERDSLIKYCSENRIRVEDYPIGQKENRTLELQCLYIEGNAGAGKTTAMQSKDSSGIARTYQMRSSDIIVWTSTNENSAELTKTFSLNGSTGKLKVGVYANFKSSFVEEKTVCIVMDELRQAGPANVMSQMVIWLLETYKTMERVRQSRHKIMLIVMGGPGQIEAVGEPGSNFLSQLNNLRGTSSHMILTNCYRLNESFYSSFFSRVMTTAFVRTYPFVGKGREGGTLNYYVMDNARNSVNKGLDVAKARVYPGGAPRDTLYLALTRKQKEKLSAHGLSVQNESPMGIRQCALVQGQGSEHVVLLVKDYTTLMHTHLFVALTRWYTGPESNLTIICDKNFYLQFVQHMTGVTKINLNERKEALPRGEPVLHGRTVTPDAPALKSDHIGSALLKTAVGHDREGEYAQTRATATERGLRAVTEYGVARKVTSTQHNPFTSHLAVDATHARKLQVKPAILQNQFAGHVQVERTSRFNRELFDDIIRQDSTKVAVHLEGVQTTTMNCAEVLITALNNDRKSIPFREKNLVNHMLKREKPSMCLTEKPMVIEYHSSSDPLPTVATAYERSNGKNSYAGQCLTAEKGGKTWLNEYQLTTSEQRAEMGELAAKHLIDTGRVKRFAGDPVELFENCYAQLIHKLCSKPYSGAVDKYFEMLRENNVEAENHRDKLLAEVDEEDDGDVMEKANLSDPSVAFENATKLLKGVMLKTQPRDKIGKVGQPVVANDPEYSWFNIMPRTVIRMMTKMANDSMHDWYLCPASGDVDIMATLEEYYARVKPNLPRSPMMFDSDLKQQDKSHCEMTRMFWKTLLIFILTGYQWKEFMSILDEQFDTLEGGSKARQRDLGIIYTFIMCLHSGAIITLAANCLMCLGTHVLSYEIDIMNGKQYDAEVGKEKSRFNLAEYTKSRTGLYYRMNGFKWTNLAGIGDDLTGHGNKIIPEYTRKEAPITQMMVGMKEERYLYHERPVNLARAFLDMRDGSRCWTVERIFFKMASTDFLKIAPSQALAAWRTTTEGLGGAATTMAAQMNWRRLPVEERTQERLAIIQAKAECIVAIANMSEKDLRDQFQIRERYNPHRLLMAWGQAPKITREYDERLKTKTTISPTNYLKQMQ